MDQYRRLTVPPPDQEGRLTLKHLPEIREHLRYPDTADLLQELYDLITGGATAELIRFLLQTPIDGGFLFQDTGEEPMGPGGFTTVMSVLIAARRQLSEAKRPDRLTPLELDGIVWDMINEDPYPTISYDELDDYITTAEPFPRWLIQKALARDPPIIDGPMLDRLIQTHPGSIFWLYHSFPPEAVGDFRHRYVLETERQWAQLRASLQAVVGRNLARYLESAL